MKTDKLRKGEQSSETGTSLPISRRNFLKTLGGGIVILFSTNVLSAQERAWVRSAAGTELPQDFNAFLRIGEDGRVSCFTGKIEMGQGIITSLAQMLADELDVPLDRVDMVMGDTDLCPWDMGTFGSRSTRFFGPPLREAAAMARSVLLSLAAERLNTPLGSLAIEGGVIADRKDATKRVTYQQLTSGKYIEKRIAPKPALKRVSEFTVMGRAFHRTDGAKKATGEARFAGDILLPGMLYAKILRPPVHGAKLKYLDTAAARNVPGVTLIQEPGLIAVLHQNPDAAERALSQVKAEFEIPESNLDNKSIFAHLLQVAPKQGETISEAGDLRKGVRLASKVFEEAYYDHYVAHAAIETHTTTAKIENGKVTVWPSTQRPFATKEDVARALGLPATKVRVVMPLRGRRVWGQEQYGPVGRGCAPRQVDGKAGSGHVEQKGGVLLRHLQARCNCEDKVGCYGEGKDNSVGI